MPNDGRTVNGATPLQSGGEPLALLRRFQQEMDRRTSRFFSGDVDGGSGWSPAVEVTERNGQFEVSAELPGVQLGDVSVEVTGNVLLIEGHRKGNRERRMGAVYPSERLYGKFHREIRLPEGADASRARAEFRDGVLRVTMPAPEHKYSRRPIPIENASR